MIYPLRKWLAPKPAPEHSLEWQNPVKADFALTFGTHIWRIPWQKLDPGYFLHLLDDQELKKAGKYRNPEDQKRAIIGRGVLKELSASYLKTSHKNLNCSTNKFGKPFLAKHHNHLQFNISHSAEIILLVFGFSPLQIGIDIEKIKLDFDYLDIADQYFSDSEKDSLQCENPSKQFFKIWTRKEAIMKALGKGLTDELFTIDVLDDTVDYFIKYNLRTFELNEEMIFSLATPSKLEQIKCFDYELLK